MSGPTMPMRESAFTTVSHALDIPPTSVNVSSSAGPNSSSTDTRPRTAPTLYMRHRFASSNHAQLAHFGGIPSLLHVNPRDRESMINPMMMSSRGGNGMNANSINVRPQFRTKVVCDLRCGDCNIVVCRRGMRAILLADTNVELFSTDCPPIATAMVNDDYVTRNCNCRIRDVACLNCGNLAGYHVTQPCESCMEACNNGHFFMFHIDAVTASERMDGGKVLLWSQLPLLDKAEGAREEQREIVLR